MPGFRPGLAAVLIPTAPGDSEHSQAILAKVTLRLIPFLFLLYIINLVDRTNIGISKLQMLGDLKMNEAAYGFGAGLFYVGYLLFEVPSNLILARVGARVWIARILISWGIISSAMMFCKGPWSFYALRILLGVAEAGFFPGIILYLSHWFPARARARALAKFMVAGVMASMIGNPISGAILQYMDGAGGLRGWKWVYLLEGIPAVVMGFVTLFYLTERPALARWLTPAERDWLVQEINAEQRDRDDRGNILAALVDPRVWVLIAIYFTVAVGDNTFGFFLPSMIKSRFPHAKEFNIGMLASLPSIVAVVAMLLVARHSDRSGERRWHIAGSAFVASAGWVMLAFVPSPWIFVAALAITLAGMKSMLPTFWTLPTSLLSGTAAAAGIALINSVANLGGLFAPITVGKLKDASGDFSSSALLIAAVMGAGGILVLWSQRLRARYTAP